MALLPVIAPFYCLDQGQIAMRYDRLEASWDPGYTIPSQGPTLDESVLRAVRDTYGAEGRIHASLPTHTYRRPGSALWIATPRFVSIERDDVSVPESEELVWTDTTSFPTPVSELFERTYRAYRTLFDRIVGQPL